MEIQTRSHAEPRRQGERCQNIRACCPNSIFVRGLVAGSYCSILICATLPSLRASAAWREVFGNDWSGRGEKNRDSTAPGRYASRPMFDLPGKEALVPADRSLMSKPAIT